MYEVFFNDRVIYISPGPKNLRLDNSLSFYVSTASDVDKAWNAFLCDDKGRDMFLMADSAETCWSLFSNAFSVIDAAGGFVTNNDNRLLCIQRWGKWDLPKGKTEKNEAHDETAIREVEEECGISNVVITDFNSITYHIYEHPRKPGRWVLKQTFWYNMSYAGNEELVPQTNEDIEKACWFSKAEMHGVTDNTWHSLMPLFEKWVSSD